MNEVSKLSHSLFEAWLYGFKSGKEYLSLPYELRNLIVDYAVNASTEEDKRVEEDAVSSLRL